MSEFSNTFQLTQAMPYVYTCTVKLIVKTYTSGSNQKYDINCEYSIPEEEPQGQENPAHPFYQKRVDDVSGAQVIKNAVTESMVNYLMMTDSELSEFTGITTPMQYRKLLLNSLFSLWD